MAIFNSEESKKKLDYNQEEPKTIVGQTMFIKGIFNSEEEVLVEGKIEGEIKVKNRLVVGKSGKIEAEVEADEIIIEGRIDGNIKGLKMVRILPNGILNGNIVAKRVVLSDGAIFKGNIDMSLLNKD